MILNPAIIVADASPLIALAVMDLIPVLPKLFDRIYVPAAVVRECLEDLTKPKAGVIKRAFEEGLLQEKSVTNEAYVNLLAKVLDQGEAEAISLAKELDVIVLMDERAGRNVAERERIKCIGSLYCLIRAKQAGLIEAAAPKIKQLRQHGYHLHDSLVQVVLDSCGESSG